VSAPFAFVILAASTGGLAAIAEVLSHLPGGFAAAVAIVLHRAPLRHDPLPAILSRATALPVTSATGGQLIVPGTAYVAPASAHLYVDASRSFALVGGKRFRSARCSADPLLTSAAEVFGPQVIAVILTGRGRDGTAGAAVVKHAGGIVIAQDLATAAAPQMPQAARAGGVVDSTLPLSRIGPRILELVGSGLR
jgi:two-component system chemotaxis response regulator CheB